MKKQSKPTEREDRAQTEIELSSVDHIPEDEVTLTRMDPHAEGNAPGIGRENDGGAPSSNNQPSSAHHAKETEQKTTPKSDFYDRLQNFFGVRKGGVLNNSSVLLKRMKCNLGHTKRRMTYLVMDVDKTEVYAEIPRIPLNRVWHIVQSEEAQNLLHERATCTKKGKKRGYGLNNADFPLDHGYTEQTWSEDMRRISEFLTAAGSVNEENCPILISDIWEMSDLDYQTVFLGNATNMIRLLQLTILTDTRENARLRAKWSRIKRYLHRVPLEKSQGGVFSDSDARILRENGVRYLNDVRKKSIFELKNMFLEHDFKDIIQELNEAFKEDLARRRDRRYKVRPYVTGFLYMTATAVIAFVHRYTLIKNDLMTRIIMVLLAICALTIPFIIIGAVRAIFRRRTKRKDYYYFTTPVKRACKLYATVSVFVLLTLALFYGRYDGYNETFYYRDLDDGSIAVAGLVKNKNVSISIPETIDGKQVSEIDLCAFYRDDFPSVSLPSSLRKIDRAAFLRCDKLNSVTFSEGITTIEKNAFRHCEVLSQMTLPTSLTTLGTHSFDGTNIAEVSFVGLGITELPEGVFSNCEKLEKVEGLTQIQKIGDSAFDGCVRLSEVQFSLQLREIGVGAFRDCRALKSLTVPTSVQSIGRNAFQNCTGLETVSLPYLGMTKANSVRQSLKSIMSMKSKKVLVDLTVTDVSTVGSRAFTDVDWIHTVTLGGAVTDISDRAFKGLTRLKTVNLSPSVKQLRNSVFEGCAALETLTNTSQITQIGKKAFKNCPALTALDMSAVKTIEREAFLGCSALKTFQGLESVADIHDKAFYGCKSLSAVPFGSSLQSIGKQAFDGCTALKSIVIPTGVTRIGRDAFANVKPDSLTVPFFGSTKEKSKTQSLSTVFNVTDPNHAIALTVVGVETVTSANLKDCHAVKRLILGDGVKSIAEKAFADLPLRIVTLPASVTVIPNSAFLNCTDLKQLNGDEHVTTIGDSAFSGCVSLAELSVASVKTVGSYAFENCAELQFSGSWESIETIGERAFVGAEKVQSLDISSSISYLSDYAFADSKLNKISLPDSIREIGEGCFENSAIQSIELPQGVESIGEGAFRNCESLQIAVAPSSLTVIREEAFRGTGLVQMDLEATKVSLIGAYAFADCNELVSISLPESIKVIPEGLIMNSEGCTLQNLQLLSLEEIGAYAFKNTSLGGEMIKIADGIRYIGEEAFYNTDIRNLNLPQSLSEIGQNAFASCESLTVVTIPFVGSTAAKVSNGAAWVFGSSNSIDTLIITGMTKVEDDTFAACKKTVSCIYLNDEISKIQSGSFMSFSNLESIKLPQSLTVIEKSLFENCKSLKSISIPAATRTVRGRAFANCGSLTTVHMETSSVTKIEEEAFMNCRSLVRIYFPESLVTVKENAFAGCSSLYDVTFQKGMTRVHENAFGSHIPERVNIPDELMKRYRGKFGIPEYDETEAES